MSFTLVRVDDRLIHGQVVMYWSKVRPGDGIILVVDDELEKDDFLRSVFKDAGKKMGKNVFLFNLEQAKRKVPEAANSAKNYYLITKSISFLAELKRAGVDFGTEIIIGNTSNRPDTKKMYNNVYFDAQEQVDADFLKQQSLHLKFQLTPNDAGTTY